MKELLGRVALVSTVVSLLLPLGGLVAAEAAASETEPAKASPLIVGYVKHEETTATEGYAGVVNMEYTFESTWDELLNRDADWKQHRATGTGTAALRQTWSSGECSLTQTTDWLGDKGI